MFACWAWLLLGTLDTEETLEEFDEERKDDTSDEEFDVPLVVDDGIMPMSSSVYQL